MLLALVSIVRAAENCTFCLHFCVFVVRFSFAPLVLCCSLCAPRAGPATDLRNIVGSDLRQDEIDEIFKQFDLNSDGEIDFE